MFTQNFINLSAAVDELL